MEKIVSLSGLCLLGFVLLGSFAPKTSAQPTAAISTEKDKAEKRDWADMKSSWGKRSQEADDITDEDLQLAEIPTRSIREAAGWRDGMRASWGSELIEMDLMDGPVD